MCDHSFSAHYTTTSSLQMEPGDPAMIVIPHLNQWVPSLHFGTPLADYNDFYLTVVVQRRFKYALRLNGDRLNPDDFLDTPRCEFTPFFIRPG